MSLDSLCRWQVQVSVYCAWRIPAHLRCTQCSILLHLMDICFLTCICLWQISQIQTFLFKVVGPGLVSTSPAFVSSSASHPAGPHGRHAQKTVNAIMPNVKQHVTDKQQRQVIDHNKSEKERSFFDGDTVYAMNWAFGG